MDRVKRWYIGAYGGEAQARPCSPAEFEIINSNEGQLFVMAEDFDRAIAERDALQQLLNQRDEELHSLEQRRRAEFDNGQAAERDAVRYRWLRDKSESVHQFYLSTPIWFTGVKFSKESVDSTIDAALNPIKP